MKPILTEIYEKVKTESRIVSFIKRFDIMKCLSEAGIKKAKGYSLMEVITFLVTLVFSQKNLFAFMHSPNKEPEVLGKDVIYTFLANWFFDWRLFLLKASSIIINSFLVPLTKEERINA